jgi:hypothetical protein
MDRFYERYLRDHPSSKAEMLKRQLRDAQHGDVTNLIGACIGARAAKNGQLKGVVTQAGE